MRVPTFIPEDRRGPYYGPRRLLAACKPLEVVQLDNGDVVIVGHRNMDVQFQPVIYYEDNSKHDELPSDTFVTIIGVLEWKIYDDSN